jgi:hypothetical protein
VCVQIYSITVAVSFVSTCSPVTTTCRSRITPAICTCLKMWEPSSGRPSENHTSVVPMTRSLVSYNCRHYMTPTCRPALHTGISKDIRSLASYNCRHHRTPTCRPALHTGIRPFPVVLWANTFGCSRTTPVISHASTCVRKHFSIRSLQFSVWSYSEPKTVDHQQLLINHL